MILAMERSSKRWNLSEVGSTGSDDRMDYGGYGLSSKKVLISLTGKN